MRGTRLWVAVLETANCAARCYGVTMLDTAKPSSTVCDVDSGRRVANSDSWAHIGSFVFRCFSVVISCLLFRYDLFHLLFVSFAGASEERASSICTFHCAKLSAPPSITTGWVSKFFPRIVPRYLDSSPVLLCRFFKAVQFAQSLAYPTPANDLRGVELEETHQSNSLPSLGNPRLPAPLRWR